MKLVSDLTRAELEQIAGVVFEMLFVEAADDFYCAHDHLPEGIGTDDIVISVDKEWSGADVCDALSNVLEYVSFVPNEADNGQPYRRTNEGVS